MVVASDQRFPLIAVFFVACAAPAVALAAEAQSVAAPDIKPGDTWVFDRSVERGTSGFSTQRLDFKVEHVGTDTMVVGIKTDGSPVDFEDHVMGADWSQRRLIDGQQTTTGRPMAFPLTVGKTWGSDYVDPTKHGLQTSAEHHETYKVVGWEDVTIPAGTFHALKIESDDKVKAQFIGASSANSGAVATADGASVVVNSNKTGPHTVYAEFFATFYYVPEMKYWVKTVEDDFNSENVRTMRRTDTLVSFKPSP